MLYDQDTKPLTLQQTCQWASGFYNYVTQQHKGFKKIFLVAALISLVGMLIMVKLINSKENEINTFYI